MPQSAFPRPLGAYLPDNKKRKQRTDTWNDTLCFLPRQRRDWDSNPGYP